MFRGWKRPEAGPVARALAFALAASLVIAPVSWGGGGDNDSPYNLPNNPRDTGSPPPPSSGPESCVALAQVAVAAAPGATVNFNTVDKNNSKLQVRDAQLASCEHARQASAQVLVSVHVPGGAIANVKELQDLYGKKWVDLQGKFAVTGGQELLLTPPGVPAKAAAFLVIGFIAREGGSLAKVVDVLPLELGAGIDLVALRDVRLAKYHGIEGLGAQVVILGTSYSAGLQEQIISLEATALFAVSPGAKILVRTEVN